MPGARQFTMVISLAWMALISQTSAQGPIAINDLQRTSEVSFENEILPILRKNCLACHSAGEKQGELILESPADVLRGGESGDVVIPGNGAESLLLKLASHQQEPLMPPPDNDVAATPLSSDELGLIKLWIQQGAKSDSAGTTLSPKKWQALPARVNAIHAAVVSHDGQYVACTRSNQIFVYHVPTGARVACLADPQLQSQASSSAGIAHLDIVQSLAFNDQGDLLASGSFREVKLWRRPRDVRRLQLAAGSVHAMAVNRERTWLATAAMDHSIKLWQLPSGEPGPMFSGHKDKITSITFLPDGKRLISSSLDQTICVWSIADGVLAGKMESPAPVNAVEWIGRTTSENYSMEDAILVSGGQDNGLRLWSIPEESPQLQPAPIANATRMAASHDGTVIAFGTDEGSIATTDARTKALLKTWSAGSPIVRMSFNQGHPNVAATHLLLTTGADGRLSIWDAATTNLVEQLTPGYWKPRTAAISLDGHWLAAGFDSGHIWVGNREAAPSEDLESIQLSDPSVSALSHSRKKLAIAASPNDGASTIHLVDLDARQIAQRMPMDAIVRSLAFSADDGRLIAGFSDGSATVWDLSASPPTQVVTLPSSGAEIASTAFASDPNQLLMGLSDGRVRLWNLLDTSFKEFVGHTGPILITGFKDGQPFSVSQDRTVRFWNPADGQLIRQFNDPTNIMAATVSADHQRLAIAGDDQRIRIYDVNSGGVTHTFEGHASISTALHFSMDATRLLALSPERAILWDLSANLPIEVIRVPDLHAGLFETQSNQILLIQRQGLTRRSLRFQRWLKDINQPITDLAFQADAQVLFASSMDGTLRAYRAADGQSPWVTNHGSAIHDLALSRDGRWLASAGENGQVRIWQSASGGGAPAQPVANFRAAVHAVDWTADGSKVIGASSNPAEQIVFELATGTPLQRFTEHTQPMTSLVSTGPTGERVISFSATEGVRSWTITATRILPGHGQPVTALAALRTVPMQVYSGSTDTTIRRWNLENGQQLQQFNHGAAVTSIAVRPDGMRLAAAGNSNVARLWNADNGQQLAEMRGDVRARSLATRLNQQVQTLTARSVQAKQRMDTADQALPTKTQAEKTAADALAAANRTVEEKLAMVPTTMEAKVAQERIAIEAAAAAQRATLAKEAADKLAMETSLAAQQAQERANRLVSASQNNPGDADLAAAATAAQTEAAQSAAKAQEAANAQAAPAQAAAQTAQVANEAAAKVTEIQRPYNEAVAVLEQAEMAQNLAAQQHAIAARELQAAQADAPAAREAYNAAESALNQAKTQFEAANQSAAAAEQPIWSVSFSPNGQLLATGGQHTNAHTWDGETGLPVSAYAAHTAALRSVLFVDDRQLVSSGDDQATYVWEVNPPWELLRTIGSVDDPSLFSHRVMALDISRDGQLLATGGGVPSRRGEVHVFQISDGKSLLTIPEAHLDTVFSVRISPDGRRLASGGADKYVRTFDLANGQQLRRMEGHTNYVLAVAWKSDGQLLASSAADMTIKVWNPESGDQVQTIGNFVKPVTSVRFIGDTENVVSASGDRIVRMHNALNAGNYRNFSGPSGYLHTVDITSGSDVLVAGGQDSVLWIWDGNNGQVRQQISPDN